MPIQTLKEIVTEIETEIEDAIEVHVIAVGTIAPALETAEIAVLVATAEVGPRTETVAGTEEVTADGTVTVEETVTEETAAEMKEEKEIERNQ